MPYESFKCSHHVSIRGLVQDRQTGSWRYLIKVKRVMQDDTPTNASISFASSNCYDERDFDVPTARSRSPSSLAKALWQRRSSSSFMSGAASPTNSSSAFGYSQVYTIRRSFSEFKLLHAAMKPLMTSSVGTSSSGKNALPSLPVDSIFAFFVGETQTMLQKKRLALENILIAIENHSAAADSSEYLEFLAKTDTYEQVSKAPVSPLSSFTSTTCTSVSLASTATASSSSSLSASSTSRANTDTSRTSGLHEFTTSREAETHRIPTRACHSSDQQKRKRGGRGRRQFIEAKKTSTDSQLPTRENRVDFNRYSLV